VLHLAGRVALGVDVRNLLELERALERDGEMNAAAQVEKIARRGEILRQLLALRRPAAQRLFDLGRGCG
jgi:hypothetical protein